jgi:hypothetical protein
VKIESLSERDLASLLQAVKRQKKSLKTAFTVTIVLNFISWFVYSTNPTPVSLGTAFVGIVISGLLISIALKTGKRLKLDLRENKKEVFKGKIMSKLETKRSFSRPYQFLIENEKITVDEGLFSEYNEEESIIIERSIHAKIIFDCEKI